MAHRRRPSPPRSVECNRYRISRELRADPPARRPTDVTVGAVVSICGPLWVRPPSDRLALVPAPSLIVTPLGRLTARGGQGGDVLSGRHGVIEGQRVAPRTADVGRRSAVVQGQRRPAPGHGHRLTEVERQRDGLARVQSALRRRGDQRHHGWRRGVDLRPALGSASQRQVGGVAGAVLDRDSARQA